MYAHFIKIKRERKEGKNMYFCSIFSSLIIIPHQDDLPFDVVSVYLAFTLCTDDRETKWPTVLKMILSITC